MRLCCVLTVLLLSLATAGCGGSTDGPRLYNVSGFVTFGGEPLNDADLVIRTTDGKYAAGSKIAAGKFNVKAAPGPSIVEITAMQDVVGAAYREENPGERIPVREQFLPPKYNANSTLKVEIKPDTRELKFDLMP